MVDGGPQKAVHGTTRRVRRHVAELAGAIGERNAFWPAALRAAADYIETAWNTQGYWMEIQRYPAGGVECANFEVSRISETTNRHQLSRSPRGPISLVGSG